MCVDNMKLQFSLCCSCIYVYLFVYKINLTLFPCNLVCLMMNRILSDCIPIKGSKRISYLVIATVLSLVPWFILGLSSTLRNSTWHLMVFLTVQNLGSAMADVVVDAMVAEAVRHDKYVCIFNSLFHFLRRTVAYRIACMHIDIVNNAKCWNICKKSN